MYKVSIFLLLCCLFCFSMGASNSALASAGDSATKLLSSLSERIDKFHNYRVVFQADAEGGEINGIYLVSGHKFRIAAGDFDIIGDGSARYEINHALEEILIDNMDTTDINILSNPVKAFEFLAAGFIPSYGGQVVVDGAECDLVELQPASEELAVASIELYISRSTGLPVQISYLIDGLDGKVNVKIEEFKEINDLSSDELRFDRSKYRDYEIVDFR